MTWILSVSGLWVVHTLARGGLSLSPSAITLLNNNSVILQSIQKNLTTQIYSQYVITLLTDIRYETTTTFYDYYCVNFYPVTSIFRFILFSLCMAFYHKLYIVLFFFFLYDLANRLVKSDSLYLTICFGRLRNVTHCYSWNSWNIKKII